MIFQRLLLSVVCAGLFSVPNSAAADKLKTSIAELLLKSQKAGLVTHNFAAYIAPWDKSAVLIGGRTEKPDQHDFTLNYKKIVETRTLRFKGKPLPNSKMSHKIVSFSHKGDQINVKLKATISTPYGKEVVLELYRLKSIGGQWKIVYNRYWFHSLDYGKHLHYTASTFKKLDAIVRVAKKSGDKVKLALALEKAFRWKEIVALLKPMLGTTSLPLGQVLRLARAAMITGDPALTIKAYKLARKLDPKTPIPDYIPK